jgi:thiol-disulfide isomerase/thioredoxin
MKRIPLIVLMATMISTIGLYGMWRKTGNTSASLQTNTCAASKQLAASLRPLSTGEVAGVLVPESPKMVPDLSFLAPDGLPKTLSSMRGKVLLVNLWATWCAPCRKEMPALDQLQADLGGVDFEVVAISIDQRNLDKPKAFLQEIGVSRLAYYSDPTAKIFQELKAVDKAFGMPTTLLIDKNGCELGYLAGPAEWNSPDAVRLVKAALAR